MHGLEDSRLFLLYSLLLLLKIGILVQAEQILLYWTVGSFALLFECTHSTQDGPAGQTLLYWTISTVLFAFTPSTSHDCHAATCFTQLYALSKQNGPYCIVLIYADISIFKERTQTKIAVNKSDQSSHTPSFCKLGFRSERTFSQERQ